MCDLTPRHKANAQAKRIRCTSVLRVPVTGSGSRMMVWPGGLACLLSPNILVDTFLGVTRSKAISCNNTNLWNTEYTPNFKEPYKVL